MTPKFSTKTLKANNRYLNDNLWYLQHIKSEKWANFLNYFLHDKCVLLISAEIVDHLNHFKWHFDKQKTLTCFTWSALFTYFYPIFDVGHYFCAIRIIYHGKFQWIVFCENFRFLFDDNCLVPFFKGAPECMTYYAKHHRCRALARI